MDVSPKYLKNTEALYLLNFNLERPSAIGKGTPLNANLPLCEMDMPAGDNYNGGSYFSPITGETYYWTYNSNAINFISRLDKSGVCQIVYTNDGETNPLKLSIDPKYGIKQWRAYLYVEKSDCANRHGKYLIWTNGIDDIGWLDVEASIATNSFSTPFFDSCGDKKELISLCAPKLCECLTGEYVPLEDGDQSITNNIVKKGFKFIYRGVYYDNYRATEWSDPSSLFYEETDNCFYSSKGYSRCIKLRIPIGNPLWDKIEIGFSKGDVDSNGEGIWYLADTIDLYEKYNSSQQYWYERNISEKLDNYSDCHFDYQFCNNKQCQVIDLKEVTRVYNPIPLQAQALIPVNGGLGFYNYEQGNCPIDKFEAKKLSISPVYDETETCTPEMVAITVRAIIHSQITNKNQFVWRKGGNIGDEDDITDTAYFGGYQFPYTDPLAKDIHSGHGQQFSSPFRNFIAFVRGTEYFAEMKQCVSSDDMTSPNYVGIVSGASNSEDLNTAIGDLTTDGDFYYQEATILVPKGMCGIISLCSHAVTGLNPDTSTKVLGTLDDISDYVPGSGLSSFNRYEFEIPFDCSQSDIKKVFIIADATAVADGTNHSAVETDGYVKDNNGVPLEGLEIWAAKEHPSVSTACLARTDHNGYYFVQNYEGKILNSTAEIRGEIDCDTWGKLQAIELNRTGYGKTLTTNATVANINYVSTKFTIIKAVVNDCNGMPLQGVKIAFSGSKSQVTQSDGTAYIKARNFSTRDRVVSAYLMSKYGCFNVDCSGACNPCMEPIITVTPACYEKDTITLNPFTLNLGNISKVNVGLKSGGEYPFGFVIEGKCGRISAVNELPNIIIDKTQKKGKLNFPKFRFDAPDMELPSWASCVKIVRGVNLNDYALQWVVDKIEKTADHKLKLTIQSLNDYNSQYFFKTNTNYQYAEGDWVEFIRNGDGQILDIDKYGLLKFQVLSPFLDQILTGQQTSVANYFNQLLIDDLGTLDDITEGAIIELQHPKECVTEPAYFSICTNIPTYVDSEGKTRLVAETGYFNTFDTYIVQRQVGKFSIKTFEHKTPSDFWGGTGIDDTGRPFFVNKYETLKRYGRSISMSPPNQLNYFGDLVKTFDIPEQGDIIAMDINDGRMLFAICENDWFIAPVSNDLVRVGSDGIIRAVAPDQIISDIEPKLRGKFGCKYEDIGSVFFADGFATWIDGVRNSHVISDGRQAKDMSEDVMKSFFQRKIQEKNENNRTAADADLIRWEIGSDKTNGNLFLTYRSLRDAFISNDIAPYLNRNCTLVFSSDGYKGFVSFTPEGYGRMDLSDEMGSAFISFSNAIPFLHPIKTDKFNNFYGQSVDMIATVSFNKFPEKLKNYIACEVQSDQMWYIKEVLTNDKNYVSEVPPVRFVMVGDKWNAAFLGNKNSPEGIYSEKIPSGYFCLVTFIRNNTVNLVYNSVDNSEQENYSELDLLIAKFNLLEQSGFTENL